VTDKIGEEYLVSAENRQAHTPFLP